MNIEDLTLKQIRQMQTLIRRMARRSLIGNSPAEIEEMAAVLMREGWVMVRKVTSESGCSSVEFVDAALNRNGNAEN